MRWHVYSDVFHSGNFYDEHHFINLYFIRVDVSFPVLICLQLQFCRLLHWNFLFRLETEQHAFSLRGNNKRERHEVERVLGGREYKSETYVRRTSHLLQFLLPFLHLEVFYSHFYVSHIYILRRHHHQHHRRRHHNFHL